MIKKLTRPVFLLAVCCGLQANVALAERSSEGPEAQLLSIYKLLAKGQSEAALSAANTLTEQYPKFNLGHLIRGDILLSRSRPLSTVGDTRESRDNEQLNDLREEARGRLRALTSPPPPGALPDVLLRLSNEQKYAIVVNTSQARLYLFSHQNGQLRYERDYYASIGKAGSDKQTAGDQKTPLGVYRITSSIPGSKLTDFYGRGALTLNYPNAYDQQRGRTGYGIWLHGVPKTAYNRPPKTSNGCVVLSNPDMETLIDRIPAGTPVIIADSIKWLPYERWKQEQQNFVSNFFQQQAADSKVQQDLQSVSVYRYPTQNNMIQVSYDASVDTKKHRTGNVRDQYWTFDGSNWHTIQKDPSS